MYQYLYPQNLKAKPQLWLWGMRDFIILSIAALLAVVVLLYAGGKLLLAFALSFGFLTVRFRDTTILQTIGYAVRFFVTRQQCYLWR